MKRIIAFILSVIIVIGALASCGGTQGGSTSESTTTTTTTTTTSRQPVDYPVEVDYSYELTEPKREPIPMTSSTKGYLHVKTDKKPYEYMVGEDVVFTVTLRTFSGSGASCAYFHITLRHDGTGVTEDFYISGETGQFDLTTQIAEPGYVMMYVWACDTNKKPYDLIEMACVGAGAQLEDITPYGEEPADFDAYWKAKTDTLLDIDPEIIKFELHKSTSKYDIYNVRILAVDDSEYYKGTIEEDNPHNYVSGLLAIPKNVPAGSCPLMVSFHGHGVGAASIPDYMMINNTIVFDVIAHSIDAVNENYYSLQYGVFGSYGTQYQGEDDPNVVYYNNMLLRDLQALRFLKSYFGSDEGGNLWNGVDFEVYGYSQGGFQSCAVAALAKNVGITITHAKISAPWLCDIGACSDPDSDKIMSNFWPKGEYEDFLAYFDSIWFAKRIDFSAEVNVGLGDETTPPAGVTLLYNNLATSDKTFTLIQNKGHGSQSSAEKSYVVEFGDSE